MTQGLDPALLKLKQRAQGNELTYGFVMDCLSDYSSPRAKLTRLLESEALIRVKKGLYIFGEINGTVNYDGEHKIIVEVLNLDTNEIIREELNNNYFIFNQLVPGDYKIWAYEDINPISRDYFSGTLVPLKQSAKFIIYNKNLYVRANWSNTILMELK